MAVMLADISLSHLGVIVNAETEFSAGLTVLTGETGAGKTMVVSGLRLLAGARADASRVRTGSDHAYVEGHFAVDALSAEDQAVLSALAEELGVEPDENGEYVVSRRVSAQGRSRARLSGRSLPAAKVQQFTSHLLTIHGQHDQLRLTNAEEQLAAVDRYDPAIAPLLQNYRSEYQRWRALEKDVHHRTTKRRELAQELDRLSFALAEIDGVNPSANEDEELLAQIRRLQDVDALREAATTALIAIDGAESLEDYRENEQESASTQLGQAQAALSASSDAQLRELAEVLDGIIQSLAEISGSLGEYLEDLPADPQALDTMLQRQQELKQLTRKYAADINGVLAWRDKAHKRASSIDTSAEALEQLKKQAAAARAKVDSAAATLSSTRRKAAKKMAKAITTEIRGLAMPKARMEISLKTQDLGPSGADQAEFLLAPTDGMEGRPLASSASGGELSRVMLGLEVVLARSTAGVTMVFDEVDSGVGGRAAVEIGRRLAQLARNNQVIVVTHLPQVAAYADTHLHVAKSVGEELVTSGVRALSTEERIEELARMLAGLDDTETGRAHAGELLARAQAEVADLRA